MHDDRFEVPVCTSGWITSLNQPLSVVLDSHTFFSQGIHDLNEGFNKVLLSGTVFPGLSDHRKRGLVRSSYDTRLVYC